MQTGKLNGVLQRRGMMCSDVCVRNAGGSHCSCEIQMGDLQSEEERDIVLELRLPALPGPIEGDPVISAQLSYFNVVTSQMDTVKCQLTVNRTGNIIAVLTVQFPLRTC